MEKKIVFSGIQPSGNFHIGNYFGALKNWVEIQSMYKNYFCIVDEHAITVPYNPKELKTNIRSIAAIYLAAGINPQDSTIFVQSEVPSHSEVGWLLNTITPTGWLFRMTQYKDKSKSKNNIFAGLLNYPVLMAADILLYDTDLVPVGEDQKQHVELARDIANRFNTNFKPIFKVPQALIKKDSSKILSLANPQKKMSKSDSDPNGAIYLLDNADVIRRKIMRSVTDSIGTIEYNKKIRPGISNLMTIYSLISGKTVERIQKDYLDKGYKEFKQDLADLLINYLKPIQDDYKNLMENGRDNLDLVIKDGSEKANIVSNLKLRKIKEVMGLGWS